ncbi:glycosyltransferase [Lederbergia citri]|uniref:Glycosyltransferase n=1 Tax=Lederbergia citri TaxID=2833580 RepID=A0A942TD99_9BACI|nr:glycosyltransferase [Lederbergia citri]MBS4195806.1 glycosyltransferase [Lederbergia citri]
MKHIIVYFPYALQENPKSGSGVRPKRIVEAFKKYGEKQSVAIYVISGNSNERKELIRKYKEEYKVEDALFCYMENSTMPFWLTDNDHLPRRLFMDIRFWKFLKRAKIPIGLFYRDVYWQFDDMYSPPWNLSLLTPVMRFIYRKELKVYGDTVDCLFLPSLEMNEFVGWKGKADELPPGMDRMETDHQPSTIPPKAIYVGAISDQIGIKLMLEAFSTINKERTINLELVCRKEEYARFTDIKQYEGLDWLTISHKSGNELKDVYESAAIALIPRERNTYHDFSVPVKMFEYLSYGLPIVATDCKAHARLIKKDGLGIITEANAESFAKGIIDALEIDTYKKLKQNINDKALERHSWISRVEKVAEQLKKGGEHE